MKITICWCLLASLLAPSSLARSNSNPFLGLPLSRQQQPLWLLLSISYLSTFIDADTSTKTSSELLDEVKHLMLEGKKAEAVQLLDVIIERDAQNYLALFRRAALYLSMGRTKSALEDLDYVLELKPDFEQALLQRGKLKLKECDVQGAQLDFEHLMKSTSVEAQAAPQLLQEAREANEWIRRAKDLAEQNFSGHAEEVIDLLSKAFAVCPQDASLRELRAEAFILRGDLAQAIGDYSRAVALQVNNIPVLLKITDLHLQLGELEPAEQAMLQCLRLDPERSPCIKRIKKIRKLNKSLSDTEGLLKKSRLREALGPNGLDVEDQPDKSGVMSLLKELQVGGEAKLKSYRLLCEAESRLKRTQKAIQSCSEALKLDENNIECLCHRAEAYLQAEDYEAAVRDYSKAQEASGGQPSQRVRQGLEKAHRLLQQSKKKDYYKVLGVSRDADQRTIKKAYRKKAIEYHPDKFQGGSRDDAEKKMADINAAYEVLSNPDLKEKYDQGHDPNDPTGGAGGGHPFGGGQPFGHPIFFQGGGFGGSGGGHPFGGGGGFEFHF